jgi:putative MATE family efflux protein
MKVHQVNVLDTDKSMATVIWSLSWPTIVEQILQVTVNYADSAMVGSMGAAATAAISINTSTIWLINGLMNSIAIGFAVLMARRLGSGDVRGAKAIVRQALVAEAVFGLLVSVTMVMVSPSLPRWLGAEAEIRGPATAYMQCIAAGLFSTTLMIGISALLRLSGDTRTSLYLNTFDNIANIILNAFFIFPGFELAGIRFEGLGLGVRGAAIATSIAATLTAILLLGTLLGKGRNIGIRGRGSWKPSRTIQHTAIRLAVPIALERSTLSLGQIALTAMVSSLGTAALAAHYLANTAEQITFLPPMGIATAATTLVAQSLGAGRKRKAREYADTCNRWGASLATIMGLLMFLFAPTLIGLFTPDETVIALGAKVLRIEAFAETGLSLSQLINGALRGAGDTRAPFLVSLLGMWVVRLPLAWFLLAFTDLGLSCVWIAMMTDLNIRGIVSLVYYRRGKWMDRWTESH